MDLSLANIGQLRPIL